MAYANFERLAPVNTIRAGGPVYPLPEVPRDVWSLLTTAATRSRWTHPGSRACPATHNCSISYSAAAMKSSNVPVRAALASFSRGDPDDLREPPLRTT